MKKTDQIDIPITLKHYKDISLEVSKYYNTSKEDHINNQLSRALSMLQKNRVALVNTILLGHKGSEYIKIKILNLEIAENDDRFKYITEHYTKIDDFYRECGWYTKISKFGMTISSHVELPDKFKDTKPDYNEYPYLRYIPGTPTVYDFWVPYCQSISTNIIIEDLMLFADRIEVTMYGVNIPILEICRDSKSEIGSGRLPPLKQCYH